MLAFLQCLDAPNETKYSSEPNTMHTLVRIHQILPVNIRGMTQSTSGGLHHYPPRKTAGESVPWRGTGTGSKCAVAFVTLGQPDQANVFHFSGTHCRAFGQSILHTYTCKRQNFGSKFIPNLSFLLKQQF